VVWLAALGMILLTAGLTRWQWGRAETKLGQLSAAQAIQGAKPWGNADWPCVTPASPAASLPRFQPARLHGQWLIAQTVWLDNRTMDGGTGFIAVTPLRLSAPAACAGQVVLVERGWTPRDAARRDHLPSLPSEPGEVEVSGHLETQVSAVYALGNEADPTEPSPRSPVIRQNADHAFWQRWLALAGQGQPVSWQVSPGVLRQHDPGTPGLSRHWPLGWQGTSPDRHRAYAAQWAALCLLTVGLTVWFLVVRPHRLAHDVTASNLHA
jgi:surfeit locus 1 family protein